MNERKITVFSTNGTYIEIKTAATVWSELKPLVQEHYALDNLNPTESVGKTSFRRFCALSPPRENQIGIGNRRIEPHVSPRPCILCKAFCSTRRSDKKSKRGKIPR